MCNICQFKKLANSFDRLQRFTAGYSYYSQSAKLPCLIVIAYVDVHVRDYSKKGHNMQHIGRTD